MAYQSQLASISTRKVVRTLITVLVLGLFMAVGFAQPALAQGSGPGGEGEELNAAGEVGVLVAFTCDIAVGINMDDCRAILALSNAGLVGYDDTGRTAWLTTNAPCMWRGVVCTAGRVSSLSLGGYSSTLPNEIGSFPMLETLNISISGASGSIPSTIGNLTNLKSLNLNGYGFSGAIPASIGNLSKLTYLQIAYTKVSGAIPTTIGNLTNLTSLYLYSNSLSGSIPSEIGNLTVLNYFDAENNGLTGSIPTTIGNLTKLSSLYLSNNQLSGSIPSSIGNLTTLNGLHLENNQLFGAIPATIGNLSNADYIHLNNNQLSGSLPDTLGGLGVSEFYINNNPLSGPLPGSIVNSWMSHFNWYYTNLCIPNDEAVKTWLAYKPYSWSDRNNGTGINCGGYTISGKVADGVGAPMEGIAVKSSTRLQAITAADGSYSFTNMPNGTHTIYAEKTNWVFDPIELPVSISDANVPNQNFTGGKILSLVSIETDRNKIKFYQWDQLFEGKGYRGSPSTLLVDFTGYVLDDGSEHSAKNLDNWLLVFAGANGSFDTKVTSASICSSTKTGSGDDKAIDITQISYYYDYSDYPFELTIDAGSLPLALGKYRLYACGAESIWDTNDLPINMGTNDQVNFEVHNSDWYPTEPPSPSNTPTASKTPTPSKTPTASMTPTVSKTPTVTKTPTFTRTATLTRTPTLSPTPITTIMPTNTATLKPSRTPTRTLTPKPTRTPTKFVPTKTPTPKVTRTPTRTLTPKPSRTPTITKTPPTATPTATFTATYTVEPTSTLTLEATATSTSSPTPSTYLTPGVWNSIGDMAVQRAGHTSTLLSDGRVLIVGGANDPVFYASVIIFDPVTVTWSDAAPMSVARAYHTATLLQDGKVLVVGGDKSATKASMASAEIYDPIANTWTTTGSMNIGRAFHSATLLDNGKVLIAGGSSGYPSVGIASVNAGTTTDTAEIYNPTSGVWTLTGSMTNDRNNHAAVLLPDGRVLVAGGGTTVHWTTIISAEIYSVATGSWTSAGNMGSMRNYPTGTLLSNGTVLVAGGFSDGQGTLKTAEIYNPATNTWSFTGSMVTSRGTHTATLLPDNRVLVTGGDLGNWSSGSNSGAEVYDASVGTWSSIPNMAFVRYLHEATVFSTGSVLVTGGRTDTTALSSAEIYVFP